MLGVPMLTAGITRIDASPGSVLATIPASCPRHMTPAMRLRDSLASWQIPSPGSINPSGPRCSEDLEVPWCSAISSYVRWIVGSHQHDVVTPLLIWSGVVIKETPPMNSWLLMKSTLRSCPHRFGIVLLMSNAHSRSIDSLISLRASIP